MMEEATINNVVNDNGPILSASNVQYSSVVSIRPYIIPSIKVNPENVFISHPLIINVLIKATMYTIIEYAKLSLFVLRRFLQK